jgi:hypothetical protein
MLFTNEQLESLVEFLNTVHPKALIFVWADIMRSAQQHPELIIRCAWSELASAPSANIIH